MITRDSVVQFALRRPDIENLTLEKRAANDTYGTPVLWHGYRGHKASSVTETGTTGYAAYVRTMTFTLVNEGQSHYPVPYDRIVAAKDATTWEVPTGADVNVLEGIIHVDVVLAV